MTGQLSEEESAVAGTVLHKVLVGPWHHAGC